MSSAEMGGRRGRREVLLANVRQWWLVVMDESPWQLWIIGSIVPLVFRSVVYVFVGRMAANDAGAQWACVGVVGLALTGETISHVSDIPVYDVWFGTWGAVTRAPMPAVLQYGARSVTLVLRSLLEAAVVAIVVLPVTGHAELVLPVLLHGWMLLPAALACTAFGLAIIAVAVGNTSQDLVHNAATMLLVLTSGALLQESGPGWLRWLAEVLPLHHSLIALRGAVAGRGYDAAQLVLELAVAVGWAVVAGIAYAVVDHRTRSTGSGALQG